MAGMLSQFSDVQLLALYRCVEVEILNEAQAETASPLTSVERLSGLLRLPRRLIDEVTGFNSRHAAACIEKLQRFPAASVREPWDAAGEERLTQRVTATVHRLAALLVKHWSVPSNHAAFFAHTATDELRQLICEEYETGRDTHCQALEAVRHPRAQNTLGPESQPTQPLPSSVQSGPPRRRRGMTTPERLEAMWRDPHKKINVLAAGSAEGVARLIDRSKTSVVNAGRIWDDEISPALAAQRSFTRYHREESRLRH